MAHHRASTKLPNASKGLERETLVREFLSRVFPYPYRFGSGAVTDASGRISGQLDVVVEFPFFPSFPTPGGDQRLYLAESVAYVIEVKSNLSSQGKQVEETAEKLRRLNRRWRSHTTVNAEVGISTNHPQSRESLLLLLALRVTNLSNLLRSELIRHRTQR